MEPDTEPPVEPDPDGASPDAAEAPETSTPEAPNAPAEASATPEAPPPDDSGVELEAEAELDAELEAEFGEELVDVEAPPAPGKGVVWGVVRDEQNEAVIEGTVTVVGTPFEAITDLEGRFRLELPPGTYTLRVSYELYKSQRIDGVVVTAGARQRVDAALVPDEDAVDVVEIVAEADKTSLEGVLLSRKRATVVADGVGRAEISKSTDRNAAQAAQRVVGATVVGGRFVYVRGLGERYTNALLGTVPLPSPEPDRAAVPLDLFATGVINALTIAKTFSPDVPGDFAGGSVRIEPRGIPSEPLFSLSVRGAYNTNTTFRERLASSETGSLDWLGIDDGTRALPDAFPAYSFGPRTKPNGETITAEERREAGLLLNAPMSARRATALPDHGISVVAGNGFDFGQNRKLGVVGSLGYGRGYSVRRDEVLRLFEGVGREVDPRGLKAVRDYRATTGRQSVSLNGFGALTYQFSPAHSIALLGLRSTLADDRTQYITGFHSGRSINVHATRLAFVTRSLNLAVLDGDHRFADLGGAELGWYLSLSSATRDEPDRRDTVWGSGTPGADSVFTQATESGRHFFSEQVEKQYGAGLDWTQPLGDASRKLKLGGLVSLRNRSFWSRTLRFERTPRGTAPESCPPGQFDACNDALFADANIGPVLELRENTQETDAYDAALNVFAGYVMAELGIGQRLQVLVGERIEHTEQTIDPYDQFDRSKVVAGARIRRTDLLPALHATYSPGDTTKLRASATRTLARPQLRELAPFAFQDYFGGRVTAGNPDLELTRVTNLDARLEHFPTPTEVLAVSLFLKDFQDPIEPVILGGGDEGSLTYRNAEGASLLGIELEARRGLGGLSPTLENLSVVANLTLARSRIRIRKEGAVALTNASRPLVQQAPWVLNLALDYSSREGGTGARLLYNIVGPRLAQVGSGGLDDVYEHPRGMLDITVQQKLLDGLSLKLEGKNLLNSEVLMTQGCGNEGLFDNTWHFSCSSGEAEAVTRYTEGVTVALSASYEF